MNRERNKKNTYKTPVWIVIIYVVCFALAVGGYVLADATGQLIPGLSPLALAALIAAFAYDYYQKNKGSSDTLKPQMIILGILIAYNVVVGIMAVIAAVVQGI
ncbi:MAG: hypothetical protein MJ175_02730 [Clostridia bacterium]|nr:hypothetical protein [Clostridia bacterium]